MWQRKRWHTEDDLNQNGYLSQNDCDDDGDDGDGDGDDADADDDGCDNRGLPDLTEARHAIEHRKLQI